MNTKVNEEILPVEYHGGVAVVTMNNPPLNLLTYDLLLALRQTFWKLGQNKDLRVIVLTGTGDRAFCAGMDTKSTGEYAPGVNTSWGQSIMTLIENCPLPVIVALHGYCLGGGLEMSLACDIRIAAENAVFRFPEAGIGLTPAWGGASRLPWLIGEGNAKMMFYTGYDFTAQEAYQMGLVQKCVPKEQLMDTCMELAQRIATRAPKSLAAIKKMMHTSRQAIIGGSLIAEQELTFICVNSEDTREGMAAMKEKRQPVFKNK